MRFDDFIKQGIVKKGEKDKILAKALIVLIKNDRKILDNIPINDISARRLMCDYYDLLRMLIGAIAALDGIKSYSHEAFTYFLKDIKKEDIISEKFDRYRLIRNRLEYYGKNISQEEASKNIEDIKDLIKILKEKYLKEVKE